MFSAQGRARFRGRVFMLGEAISKISVARVS